MRHGVSLQIRTRTSAGHRKANGTSVIVATTHTTKTGDAKVVEACTYPLTADRAVDLVVTEAATFAVRDGGLTLIEVADGFDADWVRAHTAADYAEELA